MKFLPRGKVGSFAPLSIMLAALLAILALSATASAGEGGMTISSAPELPLGRTVASTVPASVALRRVCVLEGVSGEFWRVTMNAFDHLVADFRSTNGNVIEVIMLAPSVTDATVDEAATTGGCLDGWITSTQASFDFQAAGGGRYTMFVVRRQGSNDLSYEMVAHVLHETRITIAVPTRAKAHARVTYRGRVTGASGGAVTLQTRASTDSRWKKLAVVDLSAAGTFGYQTRVAGPGVYRVRASYPGDDSHRPSSATASFKVTR